MVAENIPTQDAFATMLGVEKKRLNNPFNGYTLSVDLAMRIRNTIPGMTRDWLYDGDEGGLPVSLRDRLREAATTLRAATGRGGAEPSVVAQDTQPAGIVTARSADFVRSFIPSPGLYEETAG